MRRLLVLPLLLTGCFFPADRGRALEARVDVVTDENRQLREQLTDTTSKLEQTTARLQEALDQLDKASRTTGANIGVKVDSAIQDVATLRGQIEGYQFKIGELETRLKDLETRPVATKEPDPKKDELKRPDDPKEFLKLADDKAKGGDVELARRLYAEFIKKWPREESSGEAHFGLGETYFNDQKCREALYEYGKVIQEHPKTRSAPTAYLRSADCFKELKMVAEAKLALEELQKQFPKSDAAKSVKQKLAELQKSAAPQKAPPKGPKK